mmetsp:Transcript_55008/g.119981  ORF Transcript_55008/g.119981 Transcript_55008/m.119981 type:complete len:227 (-) Transcript_55008:554-1234(-)
MLLIPSEFAVQTVQSRYYYGCILFSACNLSSAEAERNMMSCILGGLRLACVSSCSELSRRSSERLRGLSISVPPTFTPTCRLVREVIPVRGFIAEDVCLAALRGDPLSVLSCLETLGPLRRASPLGSRRPLMTSRTSPVRRQHDCTTPRSRSVQKMCVGPRAIPQGEASPVATSQTREPSRPEHCTLPVLASVQNILRLFMSKTRDTGSTSPLTTVDTWPVLISQH